MPSFALFALLVHLAAPALAVIVGPWAPSETGTMVNFEGADFVPSAAQTLYWTEGACEANRAYSNWASKVALCGSETNPGDCEQTPYCFWRDTRSQNYLAVSMNLSYVPEIRRIAEGVYDVPSQTAGIARMQVVEVSDGIVLFDCLDTPAEAALAKQNLRALLGDKVDNVRAVFYSHSHVDHFYGCPGWLSQARIYPAGPVHIYAHMQFVPALQNEGVLAPVIAARTAEQFGNDLPAGKDGSLYPVLEYIPTGVNFFIPTDWLNPLASTNVVIDGRYFVALPLACETDSNIALWIPDRRVALISSIYFRTIPFVGTIRGGAPRSIDKWISALVAVKNLAPVALGVSHSFPLVGEAAIQRELQWVIDRMTYIRNFAIAGINAGKHPRDVALELEHLNQYPDGVSGLVAYEMYGYPYAAVRGIYANMMGWYSGAIEELEPVSTTTESVRLVSLLGGVRRTTGEVRNLLKTAEQIDDLRWALQLAAHALRAAQHAGEDDAEARQLYSEACRRLALLQINFPKRNTYLSKSLEVLGDA